MNVDVRSTTSRCFSFTQTDPLQATVGQAYPSTYTYANNNPNLYTDPSGLRAVHEEGEGAPRTENPVGDSAPAQLAQILSASGVQLPPKGCLPGDEIGLFYDTKSGPFFTRKTVRKVHLCGGIQKSKGSYGLAHINFKGHFGKKLATSAYAQELVASAIEDGAHGQYKGGGEDTGNTNYYLPFACRSIDFRRVVFIFDVTVGVQPSDRIQTAYIAKNDFLDHLDPELIQRSCRKGHYPVIN
jgi:hypothetical protein